MTTVVSASLILATSAGPAAADRAFAPRFAADADGGIALAANTLETCPAAALECPSAQDGTGRLLDDNDFAMRYVDVDSDAATFDSSSARLVLPDGARVLFAGLYVGARTEPGTRGQRPRDADPDALRTVLIRGPGQDSYERLGPVGATLDQSSGVRGAYQVVHDVTDLVRRAGAGEYTVADVQAATGVDRYAGWALLVAYAAPGDPPRNLAIFDGLASVTRGQAPTAIPLDGFTTPLDGPVRTQVGVVGYEGDLGSGGDAMTLDGHPLSDAMDPAGNFFDSGISVDGVPSTGATPDYRNQLGFDAKLVRADGDLPNAATSAQVTLTTSLEQYLPGVVTFATDLYAPDIRASKTVEDLTRPGDAARAGDRLRYSVTYRNAGAATARDVVASDPLPDGVTLVPGSLRETDVDGSTTLTDPPGDDAGDYDPATRTVRVRLGPDATSAQGGSLVPAPAAGDEATVSFEAEVDPSARPAAISNSASATATAPSLTRPLEVVSDPAVIDVRPSDVSPPVADLGASEQETAADSGAVEETTDDVTVTDHGPADATDVHTVIELAPGETIAAVSVPDGACRVDGLSVICDIPHLDAGASVQIDVVERDRGGPSMVAPTEVTTDARQLDEDAADNAAITRSVPAPAPLPAGDDATLVTRIRPTAGTGEVGARVGASAEVRDDGPGAADRVVVEVTPSVPVSAATAVASGSRCRTVPVIRCTVPRLAAGRAIHLRLSGRPRRAGPLTWTVEARSDRFDSDPARRSARVTIPVRGRPRPSLRLRLEPDVIRPGQSARLVVAVRNTPTTPASICVHVGAPLRLAGPTGATPRAAARCWVLRRPRGGGVRRSTARVVATAGASIWRTPVTATVSVGSATVARTTTWLTIRPAFLGCAASGRPSFIAPDC